MICLTSNYGKVCMMCCMCAGWRFWRRMQPALQPANTTCYTIWNIWLWIWLKHNVSALPPIILHLGKLLWTPVVKFMADALSHVSHVVLILLYYVNECASDGNTLSTEDEISAKYKTYLNDCQNSRIQAAIQDVFIWLNQFSLISYVIWLFVAGVFKTQFYQFVQIITSPPLLRYLFLLSHL